MESSGWRFTHVGVIVKDADKSCKFYQALGFSIIKGPFTTVPAKPDAPQSRIVHLQKENGIVELIQPLAGKFVNMEFLETVGEGANHICFEVDDLAAEKKKMVAEGYPELYGSDAFGYFDTRANGNMIIELKQKA